MKLTTAEQHQLRVARKTINTPDAILGIIGGPTKDEAREIIARLTAKQRRTR